MDVVQWIMLAFLILPLALLFASMCIEIIVDTVKDIIENIKGDYK